LMKNLFARHVRAAVFVALPAFATAFASPAGGQQPRLSRLDFATGTQFEDYLRVLQVAGIAPLYPWSIRGFSNTEVARLVAADSTGPWRLVTGSAEPRFSVGSIATGAIVNSAYPYGSNDGPVWAGRGLTGVLSGGVSAKLGVLSFSLVPVAFRTSNLSFPLLPTGQAGRKAFANGLFPNVVDYPQRFGDGPYGRLDPGTSQLRVDTKVVTVGISTANEWIGPAAEYPFLLGDNAPGFPHLFVGTGSPLSIGIGKLHARVMWGKLYQSAYSPVEGGSHMTTSNPGLSGRVRLTTSGTMVFTPRGVPGLELGFARFFHVPYRPGGPDAAFWKKPFKVFFLKNEYAQGDSLGFDNQLASAFFRWVFPTSGFELYGERGHEDQFYDLRDYIQDPDHERSYMLGMQKVLRRKDHFDVLRGEVINYQLPTIARVRDEGAVYLHTRLTQGHTNRGQLLGASAGVGAAAASTLSWTRYSSAGRTTFLVRRIVRADRGNYQNTRMEDPRASDVIMSYGAERMRFGTKVDVGAKLEVMEDYNRNFARDVPNLNLQLTARWHPF
jgi:hypothetical protein